ncbi:hypothetical protein HDE69_004629 [Pedobacter cryoconitis]|uniref:Heme-binding HmuY-like protein n=1 Tax=Pedobacter cryoconitis TaxID=188932 RepID=A0A7W9DLS7_9SPHI|nr:HmuY family protein [Pedobacter cryoconitis]MBB5623543.1 hypothetical protein [Pedobacter cryoconitis]MBB5645371.1 hypothetical protein [Pedobacter cryoconitis]
MKSVTTNRIPIISSLALLVFMFSSCSKENDVQPDTPQKPVTEEPFKGTAPFNTLTRITNLQITKEDALYAGVTPPFYYSLENNKAISPDQAKTADWDIAFDGIFNSFLEGNSSTDKSNKGFRGGGNGGILILPLPFDQVTTIPADSEFKTKSRAVGSDDAGAFGEGVGWYLYDYGGTIRGGGAIDKKHVAYAMPETRTIILRTAKGNYAKIKIISCYKDVLTADKMFKDTPKMFLTFDFILLPKGSTKF